jgi:23S rRNA (uridine2552-2'-O)-methyltransferase
MPKHFSPQDHYFHQAKKDGYRARSAYKLLEILKKFPKCMRRGSNVLDLGSAPGSFLQVLGEKNEGGKVCGVDLQEIKKFPRNYGAELKLIQGDIFEEETAEKIFEFFGNRKVDVITSDLAPKTSGVKSVDQWKSIELNQRVLEICEKFLKPNGNLVAKIFRGEDFDEFWVEEFRDQFKESKTFKPASCRDRSFEFFMVGFGYKGNANN